MTDEGVKSIGRSLVGVSIVAGIVTLVITGHGNVVAGLSGLAVLAFFFWLLAQ